MRPWKSDARTCVASMSDGDFYGSEKSHIMSKVLPTSPVGPRINKNCHQKKNEIKASKFWTE